jgi:hypothetical protein
MSPTEARLIEALAQGIDPETGEILPKESQLQRPVSDQGVTVDKLAHSHVRSKGGIAARLIRLCRIKERSEIYTWGGVADPQTCS